MHRLTLKEWIEELKRTVARANGCSERQIKVDEKEASKWYDDGFTPYQCFRETYDMENDSN